MPYVNVPNDLSKIKTKMAFNLTKRQLVCFGGAAAVGIPSYLLARSSIGNTGAMFLNSHDLDSMDVEEHIPVMEQKIVSLVRRSWGIDGRSDLLDMIRYLAQEGYILRYQLYSEASSPEELMDETMDEDDRESTCRAWRFAQRYKGQYAPGFMAGWDIGRAAMLTRWGCYLGWITESEAVGILWDLSQKVVEELHSWREFAQSYLFGGLMWKLLCGDSSAGSYLGYLADAATDLLTGKAEQDNGQWRDCPWPAQRKIGFTL